MPGELCAARATLTGAQMDQTPACQPSSREWQRGDVIVDRFDFVMPAGARAGMYRCFVGLYDALDRVPRGAGSRRAVRRENALNAT
jgi:hypothetical protein